MSEQVSKQVGKPEGFLDTNLAVAPRVVEYGHEARDDHPRGEVLQARHGLDGVLPDHVHCRVLRIRGRDGHV